MILSFEGPDVYSQAGGLGVRVKGLSRALARLGYDTHLFFIGDPELPSQETHESGRLHYHRWCQWLSSMFRGGVYDGEEDKLRDWDRSIPAAVIDGIVSPAIDAGHNVVVLGEEWQTAATMNYISDSLYYRGWRDRVVMLWNANNTFSFKRINWGALGFASAITTVSRYMKFRMWEWGQNPIVIPNGIPSSSVVDPEPGLVTELRNAASADHLCFKIGRFDPDKRWLSAVSAMAYLKRSGSKVKLLMRGGREPHGVEVLQHARNGGLAAVDVKAPIEPVGLIGILREHSNADVINFTSYVSDDLLALIYVAADAVLANSGHEPFGLVGLEVMAAGGLAVTGSTGEDYAEAFRNALVLETDDPVEIVSLLRLIKDRPDLAASIRERGRSTARDYAWEKVIEQLLLRTDLAAAQQAVRLAAADLPPAPTKITRSPLRRRKTAPPPKSIT